MDNGVITDVEASNNVENNEKMANPPTDQLQDAPKKQNKVVRCIRMNLLTLLTVLGVVLGVALGLILRSVRDEPWTPRHVMYVNFLGDIFLRLLKSLILPLIISSLISAIANLDLSLSKKIATRAIFYYMATTILAIILGIVLVVTIQPGRRIENPLESHGSTPRNVTIVDTLLDLLRNMFPPNLIEACIYSYRTELIPVEGKENDLYAWAIGGKMTEGMNILGLVVFSAIFGIVLAQLGPEAKLLARFFHCLMVTMMKITTMVIWVSPLGIFFLVGSKIMEIDDFGAMMGQLGLYFVTVLGGVLFHGFVVLPILFSAATRRLPFRYMMNMAQAMATAFGTASSSATLPVTIQCLEEKNNVDMRVSRFVLPIGATINMDGTALYEAVAAIFIAQYRNISLSVGDYIAISLTATAASIGAAGIPQAGLVTMVMVLDSVGLPAEDVTLILAVDWLLDRFRTAINVMGDAYGAGIVDHLSRDELQKLQPENTMITRDLSD